MKPIIPLVSVLFVSSVAHAQLLVELKGTGACREEAEVFVGREKTFLFHVQLPSGGNAEFKLKKGQYDVRALTKSNCAATATVDFDGKQTVLEVKLDKRKDRLPAQTDSAAAVGTSMFAGVRGNFGMWPMPWWYPYYYPYYANIGYPCAWSYYGCMGPQYPSGGPIVMGKPNIYISGPAARLKVNLKSFKGLMASAPAHMEKGWSVDVKPEGLSHNGAIYRYLYYDLRTAGSGLQFTQGYCGGKDELLSKMESDLKAASYPAQAVDDFRDHWSVHFPSGRDYCVLPQANEELAAAAPLEYSAPVFETRRVYVVLPRKIVKGEPALAAAVFKDYKADQLKEWSPRARREGAGAKHAAFEWGLAFAFP
ncbi:MAG TPA: hypothetical protein VFV50_14790 [Bdellovibrionales bacterium]|nr:hypothetical protein [Bdellovibrionales bacterium]